MDGKKDKGRGKKSKGGEDGYCYLAEESSGICWRVEVKRERPARSMITMFLYNTPKKDSYDRL